MARLFAVWIFASIAVSGTQVPLSSEQWVSDHVTCRGYLWRTLTFSPDLRHRDENHFGDKWIKWGWHWFHNTRRLQWVWYRVMDPWTSCQRVAMQIRKLVNGWNTLDTPVILTLPQSAMITPAMMEWGRQRIHRGTFSDYHPDRVSSLDNTPLTSISERTWFSVCHCDRTGTYWKKATLHHFCENEKMDK